jgi:hypothetical protein
LAKHVLKFELTQFANRICLTSALMVSVVRFFGTNGSLS